MKKQRRSIKKNRYPNKPLRGGGSEECPFVLENKRTLIIKGKAFLLTQNVDGKDHEFVFDIESIAKWKNLGNIVNPCNKQQFDIDTLRRIDETFTAYTSWKIEHGEHGFGIRQFFNYNSIIPYLAYLKTYFPFLLSDIYAGISIMDCFISQSCDPSFFTHFNHDMFGRRETTPEGMKYDVLKDYPMCIDNTCYYRDITWKDTLLNNIIVYVRGPGVLDIVIIKQYETISVFNYEKPQVELKKFSSYNGHNYCVILYSQIKTPNNKGRRFISNILLQDQFYDDNFTFAYRDDRHTFPKTVISDYLAS